ncbi:MAG: hypothetical protein IJK99_07025 [Bacteroidales bacterium]|nr:hypothetical protein [Bacteroidales bacterium]
MRAKKVFFLGVFAVLAFTVCSCFGESRLEKFVEKLNEECPTSMGEAGEMTGVELKDGNAVVKMTVNEEIFSIEALKANPELLHSAHVLNFSNPTDEMKEFIDELRRCGAGLTYVYVGNVSGNEVSATLTSREIKELSRSNGNADPDQQLDAQIAIANAQLPVQIDETTVMSKLEREDDCIVYYYDVDDTQFSLDALEESRDLLTTSFIDNLRQQKEQIATKDFIRACILADVDIAYCYRGTTTGREIRFYVPIDSI